MKRHSCLELTEARHLDSVAVTETELTGLELVHEIMRCALCRYGYMIDNVILLITGGLNNLPISDLIPRCHPMGSFEGMAAVNIASTLEELYSAIIIDTPIGRSRSMHAAVFCVKKQNIRLYTCLNDGL